MFSVGTNFDPKLIDEIAKYDVYEIYGKLSVDIIGGCRPPVALKNVTRKRLVQEIEKAHDNNIEFNYILNSSCMGNIEYSKYGFKQIIKLLDFLSRNKVDTVTVTIPYLVKFIKKYYKKIKISVSTLAGVNNIKKFENWQNMGVDSITLDISVNRNFSLLKYLSKNKKCDVKLMLNQCCEIDCIYYNYHTNVNSHQSQNIYSFPLEYCSFDCKYRRTKKTELLLSAPWIRPEDLKYYKSLGFDKFKIVQRQDPSEKIIRSVKAYYNEKYNGNLLDIMNFVYNLRFKNDHKFNLKEYVNYLLYFFKPGKVNILKLYKLYRMINDNYDLYIDNEKLDNFLRYFMKGLCDSKSCDKCNYCKSWSRKVVSYDKNKYAKILKVYSNIVEIFIDKKEGLFA